MYLTSSLFGHLGCYCTFDSTSVFNKMERLTEGRYTCGQGCKFDSGTSKEPQWFECRMRWSILGPANRNGIFRAKELMCGDLYLVK